ncbi:hypothetical protein ACIBF1_01170 [Spirillospora sp. NPDC050679]
MLTESWLLHTEAPATDFTVDRFLDFLRDSAPPGDNDLSDRRDAHVDGFQTERLISAFKAVNALETRHQGPSPRQGGRLMLVRS